MKNLFLLITVLATLKETLCLNSYTSEIVPLSGTVICMKYIPGRQVLAIAYTNNTISFYDLSTTPAVFAYNISVSTSIVAMTVLGDQTTLLIAEKSKVSIYDRIKLNRTLSMAIPFDVISAAIPWEDRALVQIQNKFTYYICAANWASFNVRCSGETLPFTSLSTSFIKGHPFYANSSTLAYSPTLNGSSTYIKIDSQNISLKAPSNITDVVHSTSTLDAFVFTVSKNIHKITINGTGISDSCYSLNFDKKILKKSTLSYSQDVFWYITDLGSVVGRDTQSLSRAYEVPITTAIDLESMDNDQDLIIRSSDNFLYIIRTSNYSIFSLDADTLLPCGEAQITGSYFNPHPIININNNTNGSSTGSPSLVFVSPPIQPSYVSNSTATASQPSSNATNSTIPNNQTSITPNIFFPNQTQSDPVPDIPDEAVSLEEIQARQIFYCIDNCKICRTQKICHVCKSGFEFTSDMTCQPQTSISLFSTIISAPYSGIVFNLVLMEFLEEFWFFQHHNFNYPKNIQKVFSLVGSLHRNKIVPPLFKTLLKDYVEGLNLRKISTSNFLNYTRIGYQRAENTDTFFIDLTSGMFIWAYLFILFLYFTCYFLNSLLISRFKVYILSKFSCRGALFFQLFSPFIQFVSFHAFSQIGIFFAFNGYDKFNLIATILFLGTIIMFAFSGFPWFFYTNKARKVLDFYGEKSDLHNYILSLAMGQGKFFILGFINGYFSSYTIQCFCLLLLYFFEAGYIRKEIRMEKVSKLIKAPLFFKFIIKIFCFLFILASLWLEILGSSFKYFQVVHTSQQIFIVAIWTWAIGDMIFKIIQNGVIGVKKLCILIQQTFFKEQNQRVNQRTVTMISTKRAKILTKVQYEDLTHTNVTDAEKKLSSEDFDLLWNEKKRQIYKFKFKKKEETGHLLTITPRDKMRISKPK